MGTEASGRSWGPSQGLGLGGDSRGLGGAGIAMATRGRPSFPHDPTRVPGLNGRGLVV